MWLFLCLCIMLTLCPYAAAGTTVKAANVPLIAVDAGHGGSDGGAVAADGTKESTINLQITRKLEGVLCFLGCRTHMIRKGEESLADPGAAALHQGKASDVKNRISAVRGSTALISIHQNSLPGHPGVHGAQVFYNRVAPADELAAAVQRQLNRTVNSGNEKNCRAISEEICLMKKADCPAILAECGFLSCPAEVRILTSETYQKQLAAVIGAAVMEFYSK